MVGLSDAFAMAVRVCPMLRLNLKFIIAVLIVTCANSAVRADVMDSAANGFTIRHVVTIDADRQTVYQAAVTDIGAWWSSDHTVSGYAENLYLTDQIPGCFCERLGDGSGLVHLSVSFVNPGVMLRLTGGLGPLGLMGVSGNMTWEFDDAETGTASPTARARDPRRILPEQRRLNASSRSQHERRFREHCHLCKVLAQSESRTEWRPIRTHPHARRASYHALAPVPYIPVSH